MLVDLAGNSLGKMHTFLVFINGEYWWKRFLFPPFKLKFTPEYLVFIYIFHLGMLKGGTTFYIYF